VQQLERRVPCCRKPLQKRPVFVAAMITIAVMVVVLLVTCCCCCCGRKRRRGRRAYRGGVAAPTQPGYTAFGEHAHGDEHGSVLPKQRHGDGHIEMQ
jgi:hypothetical protein